MARPKLIPAVGYLRKSTVDEVTASGKRKTASEKSIAQQKKEATTLADGEYQVISWYEDPNTPGWKRGAKRPGFQAIMDRAEQAGDFQAIICDNLDRFSRASFDDVQHDARRLKKAGVRWIVTAAQGVFDLGKGNDIGEILKFAVAVWSAHEFSRQLSRRISLARRNRALEGKRTGGPIPYGMVNDGEGGLLPGDRAQVKIVRWMFEEFGERGRSLNAICKKLNKQGTPSPRGGRWTVAALKRILANTAYRGDFTFNRNPRGEFFHIDGRGEVVEKERCEGHLLFLTPGRYEAIVEPALFDKVQARLDRVGGNRGLKGKAMYPLSGLLRCGHCGSLLYGVRPNGKSAVVYRCDGGNSGSCPLGNPQVREDRLLPFVMNLLGEEIENIRVLLSAPPDAMRGAGERRADRTEEIARKRTALEKKIVTARESLMEAPDRATRQFIAAKITEMTAELEGLEREAEEPAKGRHGYTGSELDALAEWWREFDANAVSVPSRQAPDHGTCWYVDKEADGSDGMVRYLVDGLRANEMLRELGCRIELRWETTKHGSRVRHELAWGRFVLGERTGSVVSRFPSDGVSKHRNLLTIVADVDRTFFGKNLRSA